MKNKVTKKLFVVGTCEIPPPVDDLCPIEANVITACDSDNTIILTDDKTIFNKTISAPNLELDGKIKEYDGVEDLDGKLLIGGEDGFELMDIDNLPFMIDITSSDGSIIIDDSNPQIQDIRVAHSSRDKHFIHEQGLPSRVWIITHNLDKLPSVVVTDSAGTVVHGQTQYVGSNTIRIEFAFPFSGIAVLN